MEEWVPLFVAAVAAAAAVGVAFWNSRGESAELRQLKAMGEVLSTMEEGEDETSVFRSARDQLAVRVADRTLRAPTRRKAAWLIVGCIAAAGTFVAILALALPAMNTDSVVILGNIFSIMATLGGAGLAVFWSRRNQKRAEKQLKRERERIVETLTFISSRQKGNRSAG